MSHSQSQIIPRWNTDDSFYLYTPDSNAESLIATKVTFNKELTKEEILDSVASYLSIAYFIPKQEYYIDQKGMKVSLKEIHTFEIPNRKYSIAIVNIDDPDKICMTTYFQGSTGGYVTFLMLVSNLMQPQFEYPLLDGINFLYNNLELKIWTI